MSDIEFFQVGGCVRDKFMGLRSKDIDFAVQAPSFEAMLEVVEARCDKVFLVTPEFFTIRGLDPEFGPVDFVLCRKDGPTADGRRPEFVEPGTIFDDLARRDFTVNAMAIPMGGTEDDLIDPHGGLNDLRHGVLRFVGDPAERLREDALRAFRGMRFEIMKDLLLDVASLDAIQSLTLDDFAAVSTERIREELLRCFAHDTPKTLMFMTAVPTLFDLAFRERNLWLKPTSEDR